MRELTATKAKHNKRCDTMLCTNLTAYSFSRSSGMAGRLDLCQSCIDGIAQYRHTESSLVVNEESITSVNSEFEKTDTGEILTKSTLTFNEDNPFGDLEESTITITNTSLTCQYCGKVCGGRLGLSSHERHCKSKL